MSDDKNINISVIPKFADTALENIIDEPSKNIGNTFADIWYLVLGGSINLMAEKRKMKYALELKKYKAKIEGEISKVPECNRSEPDIQLIGKALEESKYCADKEELRNMFSKLIAGSINKAKSKEVLPEYITILGNMTQRIAKSIIYLNNYLDIMRNQFPMADIYQKCTNIFSKMEFAEEEKPKLENMDDIYYSILRRNVCDINDTSLRYLLNHGIVEIEEKYSPMVNYSIIDDIELNRILEEEKIELCNIKVKYKYYYVTDYGKQFFNIIM